MKRKWMMIIALMVLLISGYFIFVSATQPTQQSNKIFLNPFYRVSMTNNQNYTYNISVNPPDRISKVNSAIVSFDVYLNPTVTFSLWVNNKTCNTPTFTVSTTYGSAGQARISYDCSNIINQTGDYNITLRPSGANTGAVNGWLDLTYMNNPAGEVNMFGTEYEVGDNAKVWIQLLTSNQTPITNAVCYIDIYTPSNEEYVERALMTNMYHDGIYYYDLFAPSEIGVYPAIALCYYTAGQSYHNVTNYNINFGSYDSGSITDTRVIDGTKIRFKETTVNPIRNISIEFNYSSEAICNVSSDLLTGISLSSYIKFDSVTGDNLIFSVYNYTSNSWIELPNKHIEANAYLSVSNSIVTNNVTQAGLVNGSGTNVRFRINDTIIADGGTSDLDIDYLKLSCDQLTTPLPQEVRGASELHISNHTFEIADDVWNYTNRSLSEFNFDLVNETNISIDVWNYSSREVNASTGKLWVGGTEYSTTEDTGRIIARIISNSGEPVVGATCSIYIYQPSFPANMSAYSSGTMLGGGNITGGGQGVYYYDFPLNGEIGVHSYGINCSKLGQNYYLLGTYHIFGNNLTEIGDAVWNSTNRSLSEFNFDVVNETAIAESVWSWNGLISNNILSQFAQNVWNWTGSIASDIGNFFGTSIWNSPSRNLTYYEDTTDYTKMGEFVWNNTAGGRNLTYFPAQQDLTNYSLIQDLVTQFGNNDVTNYTLIQQMITLYGNNDMTNYTLIQYLISQYGNNDNTNYTLMQDLITQYGNTDTVNYTLVQDLITQFGNDDVTNYTYIGNLVAQFGNNNTDLTNYTAIQNLISQYGNVDSTNYSLMTELMMQFANNDSTNYSAIQNLITQYGNTDNANYTLIQYLVSQYGNNDVTNYTLMQDLITQYGNTDTVNYTLVEELVSQYSTNYTLMQNLISQYGNNDMTNYTLMQDLITQFGNNQNQTDLTNYTAIQNLITQYGNTDTANYTLIQYLVSQYGNNDNTNYTLMQDLITQYGNTDNVNYTLVQNLISQYGNVDMTDYNKIGEFVWNWTSRELTGLNLTVNATINSTQLANDIWSWSSRTLTFYADMTNYTKIDIGVWSYNNRTLFFLYGNGTGGSTNPPSGKLPLTNIEIVLPDPFYFDTTYTIYYDPVDIKGATVDVKNVNIKVLENITYTLTTPVIMTDGRYKQELTIPEQEINSITLDVNMTQGFIVTNQKAFIIPEKKKAGITGFVTMDDKTKRNLLYIVLFILFLLFVFIIVAVANKNKREKKKGY
jgi:hypothetical protein